MSTRWSRVRGFPAQTGDTTAVTAALTGGAAVVLGLRLLLALVVNVPEAPNAAPVEPLAVTATVLAAVALCAGGMDATPAAGVGLLFAGVFGLLGAVVPAATVPAALAIGGGTVVFVATHLAAFDPPSRIGVAVLVIALVGALTSGVLGAAWARPLTSTLALLALAATPLFVATDQWSLVRAAVAAAVVVGVGLSLPFVTGAITLVGTGAVGVSLPVVAVAVAGVVTAASAAARGRRWLLLAAVALLAFAGVPVTLDRAVPFALGIVTLVGEVSR